MPDTRYQTQRYTTRHGDTATRRHATRRHGEPNTTANATRRLTTDGGRRTTAAARSTCDTPTHRALLVRSERRRTTDGALHWRWRILVNDAIQFFIVLFDATSTDAHCPLGICSTATECVRRRRHHRRRRRRCRRRRRRRCRRCVVRGAVKSSQLASWTADGMAARHSRTKFVMPCDMHRLSLRMTCIAAYVSLRGCIVWSCITCHGVALPRYSPATPLCQSRLWHRRLWHRYLELSCEA